MAALLHSREATADIAAVRADMAATMEALAGLTVAAEADSMVVAAVDRTAVVDTAK